MSVNVFYGPQLRNVKMIPERQEGPCGCRFLFQPIRPNTAGPISCLRTQPSRLERFHQLLCCLLGTNTCSHRTICGISLTALSLRFLVADSSLQRDHTHRRTCPSEGSPSFVFHYNVTFFFRQRGAKCANQSKNKIPANCCPTTPEKSKCSSPSRI